jgi:hypothetical protein
LFFDRSDAAAARALATAHRVVVEKSPGLGNRGNPPQDIESHPTQVFGIRGWSNGANRMGLKNRIDASIDLGREPLRFRSALNRRAFLSTKSMW